MIFFVKYLYLTPKFGCEGRNRTAGPQVMSLMRYYFSTSRYLLQLFMSGASGWI